MSKHHKGPFYPDIGGPAGPPGRRMGWMIENAASVAVEDGRYVFRMPNGPLRSQMFSFAEGHLPEMDARAEFLLQKRLGATALTPRPAAPAAPQPSVPPQAFSTTHKKGR